MKFEWISVKDKVPKEDKWILISDSRGVTMAVILDNTVLKDASGNPYIEGKLPDLGYMTMRFRFWAPLPPPPQE